MRTFTTLACIGAIVCQCGCSSTTFLHNSAAVLAHPVRAISVARREKPISKILCLWEPSAGQGLDEKPGRGFAGQILFFTNGDPSPVPVKGTVRIYEYSDFREDDPEPEPIHLFTFENKAWNVHRTEGTLGHAYNVFIPYVEKNTGHVVCALRVEFESENGTKTVSPYTEVTLASRNSPRAAAAFHRRIVSPTPLELNEAGTEIRQDGHTTSPSVRKLQSTTIKLPHQRR